MVAKQTKLGRQMGLILFGLKDEEVDAARVLFVAVPVCLRQAVIYPLGDVAELEDALRPVMLEDSGSNNLGQFARGIAAQHIHLPEAVPPRCVTLPQEQGIPGASLAMWNSRSVAPS